MSLNSVLVSLSIASLGASLGVSPHAGATPIPSVQEEKPKVDYSKAGAEPILVPLGVDMLQEKTMPLDLVDFDTTRGGLFKGDPRLARGIRTFGTAIQPGQTLKLTLKATPMVNYSMNWILPIDKNDPLFSKVKMAAQNQQTQDRPSMSFKNTSKDQYMIFFSISGMAEQPYSVKIERK